MFGVPKVVEAGIPALVVASSATPGPEMSDWGPGLPHPQSLLNP